MRIFPVLVTAMLSFMGVYGQNFAMEQQRLHIRQNTKEKKEHPYVRTDEYVELMELIARFADNSVFNNSYAPRYQKDCDLNSATVSINRLLDSKLSLWCLEALFECCISRDKPFHPLTPPSDLRQYAVENRQEI